MSSFKRAGRNKVESGRPDRYEAWTFSPQDILRAENDQTHRETPDPAGIITAEKHLLTSFIRRSHHIVCLILSHLDHHLELPTGTLASLQTLEEPSGTTLRLLRYLPHAEEDRGTSLVGHTDIGSVTVLLPLIGGLQILPPERHNTDDAWMYVKPEVGCALINMGDAMTEWSGGLLRSDLHRVTYAPGEQASSIRYSIAYLVRPQKTVLMRPLGTGGTMPRKETSEEGKVLTAAEWERLKSVAIIAGKDVARSKGGSIEDRPPPAVTKM